MGCKTVAQPQEIQHVVEAAHEPLSKPSKPPVATRSPRCNWRDWGVRWENVATYRQKFDEAGVHRRLNTLDDLARFPFTTKQDLRNNYPYGMFAVPMLRRRAHPCVVGHDRQTDGRRLRRTTSTCGPASWRARALPAPAPTMSSRSPRHGLFTGGFGVHYGAERLGCTVIPMGGGQTAKQVQLIRDFKADDDRRDASLRAQHRR